MSYRGFKRLLGETSLERKCRFLFGTATLLLITGSFWWYAYKTEHVAYDQMKATGRLLVYQALRRIHLEKLPPDGQPLVFDWAFRNELVPPDLAFEDEVIPYTPDEPEKLPRDIVKLNLLHRFATGDETEAGEGISGEHFNYQYLAPLRASDSCITCHTGKHQGVKEGQLMAVARVKMSTKAIDARVHVNRAILITTAVITAVLIMGGSWLIVRYIIVRPVKHLKEVSDAISAGELNIRSEIQTSDEFEDLSHAFNRMLRTLVSMQDQLRRVNADLDHKVDELAQANLALFQSNQMKSDFLATMSHELRTPLNSILGFSEVLMSTDQLTDKQRRWVQNIHSSGGRLLAMINDILDLAKVEAGKMQVRIEEFSVHDLCEGLLGMFRPLAEKKNIDLQERIDPGVPVLRQDANKLQQILWNLLSNAIKFTPEGGRVVLQADSDGMHLILSVIDTGVVIAAEDQELVFEKFRQSGNPLTREHAGTGLGLSIVRELAKLLGGNVGLRSELGRGSTFTVTLPLRAAPDSRLEFDVVREAPPPLPLVPRFVPGAASAPEERGDGDSVTPIARPATEAPVYDPP